MASLCKQIFGNNYYLNRFVHFKLLNGPKFCYLGATLKSGSVTPITRRSFGKKASDEEDEVDNDKPVKFSTSEASKWKAEYSRSGGKDDTPPEQPYVVVFSVSCFLIYFGILREENDIDIKLRGGPLDTYSNIELIQLKIQVEDDLRNNRSTDKKILDRIVELEELKAKVMQNM